MNARAPRFARMLIAASLFVGVVGVRAQGVVVKDDVCALFDANGALQFGAPGVSTLAPNGILHLVCRLRVAAPGVPVILGPAAMGPCGIEGTETWTWQERISPSGEAILDCWLNPSGRRRPGS